MKPPRSRAEELADSLTDSIHARELNAGDRFGTLDEIREAVGLARTTVSEAVRLMRERGVLEIKPGRYGGLFVADETPVVRMRHTLIRVNSTPRTVREAVDLREALEGPVALNAAENCTPDAAEELRKSVRKLNDSVGNFPDFLRVNWVLHEQIAMLCANEMMRAVYTSCLGYLTQSDTQHAPEVPATYVRERVEVHFELVEAIIDANHDRILRAVARHNHGDQETS